MPTNRFLKLLPLAAAIMLLASCSHTDEDYTFADYVHDGAVICGVVIAFVIALVAIVGVAEFIRDKIRSRSAKRH